MKPDASPPLSVESAFSFAAAAVDPLPAKPLPPVWKLHFRGLSKLIKWPPTKPKTLSHVNPSISVAQPPPIQRSPPVPIPTPRHLPTRKELPLPPPPSRQTSSATVATRSTPSLYFSPFSSTRSLADGVDDPCPTPVDPEWPGLPGSYQTTATESSQVHEPIQQQRHPLATQSDDGHSHVYRTTFRSSTRVSSPPSAYTLGTAPARAGSRRLVKRQRNRSSDALPDRQNLTTQSSPCSVDPSLLVQPVSLNPLTTLSRVPNRKKLIKRRYSITTSELPDTSSGRVSIFTSEPLELPVDFVVRAGVQTQAYPPPFPSSTIQRPSFLRSESNRRWTLAAAEHISDDAIVAELERLKMESRRMIPTTSINEDFYDVLHQDWLVTQRTLFICRELLRTERNYLQKLELLSTTSAPARLVKYIPPLIIVSRRLLKAWEHDTSSSAISSSFLICETELEAAFSAWSGVVGDFFDTKVASHSPARLSRRKRALSDSGKKYGRRDGDSTVETRSQSSHSISGSEKSFRLGDELRSHKLSARELAIEPTQRVTRYVLLFRDLLRHIPTTSASRSTVLNALSCAKRLAERCDQAQTNASFYRLVMN